MKWKVQNSAWRRVDQFNNTTTTNNESTRHSKYTRSLTSDDSIHELIQELSEIKDKHLDFRHEQRDLENTEARIGENTGRTRMDLDEKQQSMPRDGSPHPLELEQIHQRSTTVRTQNHASYRRETEAQTAYHLSLLPPHGMRRRARATSVL